MREIIIDGEHFSDLDGFYDEAARKLTDNLQFAPGHNLDAFHDLLRGGFGVHAFGEPIRLVWRHYSKSKRELGAEQILKIIEVILRPDENECHLVLK